MLTAIINVLMESLCNMVCQMEKYIKALLIGIVIVTTMVACSEQAQTAEVQPEPENLEDVTVQLSWINEYSFAQVHNAVENGHFANNGLNVSIIPGGFSENGFIDPIAEVIAGNAQFATSDASNLILAREQGLPVVAIMSTLHRSPRAIISLEGAEIIRPQDMIGKTIALSSDGSDALFYSFLASQDIDTESINIVDRTSFDIQQLIDEEADAIGAWIINEAVMIEEADLTGNIIAFSDYAIDTYDSVIFTTEDIIENNPEMVQKFVDGVIAGMQDILDDTEGSIDNTLKFNDELNRDAQLRRLNAMIPLMNVSGLSLGSMQPEIWGITHTIMIDNGILEEDADWESAFTLQFFSDAEAE